MLESATDFNSKPNQFLFSSTHNLVSFDVTASFSNVQLNKMIRLIADTIYSEENSNVLLYDRGTFVKLITYGYSRHVHV